jgi:hypothetical protein
MAAKIAAHCAARLAGEPFCSSAAPGLLMPICWMRDPCGFLAL